MIFCQNTLISNNLEIENYVQIYTILYLLNLISKFDNHKNKIQSYEKKNIELFKKYSPFSDKNKENYKLLLNSV